MWKLYQKCKPLLEDINNVEKMSPEDFFNNAEILFGVHKIDELTFLSLPRGCIEVGLPIFARFMKRLVEDGNN